jgi:hypothetical protein
VLLLLLPYDRSVMRGEEASSRRGRGRGPATRTIDEDAQQAASVALMTRLPVLLTRYQAEPTVVRVHCFV